MGNSYAERVQRDRQRYLDIGLDSGAQIVHDMLCVALRDKQEQLDGALREIFGEATVPFAVRHPYVRKIDYTKRRR